MADDYLAISNTGKNITITMTPGAKNLLCGYLDRVRMVYSAGSAAFFPALDPDGYKLCKRKNVWNVSMASARCPDWPVHEREVFPPPYYLTMEKNVIVPLPKPAVDMDSMLRSLPAHIRRDMPLPPPIHIDHPEMDKPVPSRDEPAKRAEYINLAGEYFDVLVNSEDHPRFWKAYLRTLEKTEARHLFKAPDMVVAAITGGGIGVLITLLLAAAGVLK